MRLGSNLTNDLLDPSGLFRRFRANLSDFAGQPIQLLFRFDTMNGSINDHEGWYIDDVKVFTPAIPPDIQVFARDVYDLAQLIPLVRSDVALVRELLLYKVYFDVVDDGRGTAPFELGSEYRGKRVADIRAAEDLGALTGKPIDLAAMLGEVEGTFGAMGPPASPQEAALARCSRGDRYRVQGWHDERRAGLKTRSS